MSTRWELLELSSSDARSDRESWRAEFWSGEELSSTREGDDGAAGGLDGPCCAAPQPLTISTTTKANALRDIGAILPPRNANNHKARHAGKQVQPVPRAVHPAWYRFY